MHSKTRRFYLISLFILVASIFVGCSTTQYVGEVPERLELAAPFTNNMILQRQQPVPVWGFAVPGDTITVEFAGQTKTAKADRAGEWMVKLDALEASKEGRGFTVKSKLAPEGIKLRDVLVGEVWFSSGQSNMTWIAGKSAVRDLANELAKSEKEIYIREISIKTISALYPQKRATSDEGWKKISQANGFSALSLSFAYELYKELDVPIGILLSGQTNTRIEPFTQREAIEAHPELEIDVELMHTADPRLEKGRAAFKQYYQDLKNWQNEAGKITEIGGDIPQRPNLPGIAGMWRGPSQFFNGKINPIIPYGIRGAIWCQGTSNSRDGKIYAARMEALLNGWRDAWKMPEMPFYFTQMQAYGNEDEPDKVGFADIRQAQHLFFINNRENVGMVVQSDLNSARPQGIHYFNKLHPGMRMSRWALANEYGKDIAKTGPIFDGAEIVGDKAIVSFEEGSLYGGLMVGSKGMAKDYREPGKFVEPARPTPGDKLNHFRLCGADRKWHAAEATIVGDNVEVRAKDVPNPIGVQYAYNAVPMNSNLYNKAGLPATPFAVINGEFIFEEDNPAVIAANKAREERRNDPSRPYLQVAAHYRDGVILQRDQPILVWGHANAGAEVSVSLGGATKKSTANELQQWSLSLPAFKATTEPLTLTIETNKGGSRTIKNILVGDVWYLTGGRALTENWPYDQRSQEAEQPEALPLVREFRRKTKASTHPTPRTRYFETGGGKYRSYWSTTDYSDPDQGVTGFAYHFAKTLNRSGIPQGFITMSSGRSGRHTQYASPLSWTPYRAVKDLKDPAFEERIKQILLQYPDTDVAKAAIDEYVSEVKAAVQIIFEAHKKGSDMSTGVPLQFPGFPSPDREFLKKNTVPSLTYNWCVSPFAPMAVAGVLWIPEDHSIGENPEDYATELEIYAKSLPATYGMDEVPFIYAQPSSELVEGITIPTIRGAKKVSIDQWPKDLKELAIKMAKQVE